MADSIRFHNEDIVEEIATKRRGKIDGIDSAITPGFKTPNRWRVQFHDGKEPLLKYFKIQEELRLAKASNESAAKKNLELSKMREQEQEWVEWRATLYALRAAGAKGSDEGGGWSSIFSGNTNDALDKRSRLASEKAVEDAQRSSRKAPPDYLKDDYDNPERNTALLKTQDAVTFVDNDEKEEVIEQAQEVSTTEELLREEESDLWQALDKKSAPKSTRGKDFKKTADIYRATTRVGFPYPWLAKQIPAVPVTYTEYTHTR